MSISFYDVSVGSFLQTLAGTATVLDKAQAHCDAAKLDPDAVVETRLYPDMQPFRFQIRSVVHHSRGAIEGLRSGTFSPPGPAPAYTFAELRRLIEEAREAVGQVTAEELDKLAAGTVVFTAGERRVPFTAVNFILSFSLPNHYFHATTAYDILRMTGVPLEKRDYLGRLRFERQPTTA